MAVHRVRDTMLAHIFDQGCICDGLVERLVVIRGGGRREAGEIAQIVYRQAARKDQYAFLPETRKLDVIPEP